MIKKHYPLIRTIYLYLFALVGLTLLIIGAVRFINMGLKAFVFTQADQQEKISALQPRLPYEFDRLEQVETIRSTSDLNQNQEALIDQWLDDYKEWKEEADQFDVITSRRHRDAAANSSMILVGLPLFAYHWSIIRKETKNKNNKNNKEK